MPWYVFAIISAASVSAETIIEKGALRRDEPRRFAAVIGILAGLTMLPFIWIVPWAEYSFSVYLWLTACAVVSGSAFLFTARSMKHLDLSVTSPMFTLTPAIGAALGSLFLGEHLHSGQIWGMVLLVVGGYILQLKPGEGWIYPLQAMVQSKDLHLLFFALMLYPVSTVMARYTMTRLDVSPYAFLVYIKLVGGIGFAAYLHWCLGGIKQFSKDLVAHKGAFFWVSLFSTLNSANIILALSTGPIAMVQAVKRQAALFTTIIGGEIFHEEQLVRKTFACLLMVAGVLIVVLG